MKLGQRAKQASAQIPAPLGSRPLLGVNAKSPAPLLPPSSGAAAATAFARGAKAANSPSPFSPSAAGGGAGSPRKSLQQQPRVSGGIASNNVGGGNMSGGQRNPGWDDDDWEKDGRGLSLRSLTLTHTEITADPTPSPLILKIQLKSPLAEVGGSLSFPFLHR